MTFTAKATSPSDFLSWIQSAKQFNKILNSEEYDKLSAPSKNNPQTLYSSADTDLFDKIIMKFMPPTMEHGDHK
jgi:cytochrome o ubiquinol oxidase subunit 2